MTPTRAATPTGTATPPSKTSATYGERWRAYQPGESGSPRAHPRSCTCSRCEPDPDDARERLEELVVMRPAWMIKEHGGDR